MLDPCSDTASGVGGHPRFPLEQDTQLLVVATSRACSDGSEMAATFTYLRERGCDVLHVDPAAAPDFPVLTVVSRPIARADNSRLDALSPAVQASRASPPMRVAG